ncbi:MAG TPA: AMP-binding protein [Bacillota bacterium]|nr:AMP-binding protein [Bacillota bacterium]
MNISDLITTNVAYQPQGKAIICGDDGREYTWSELDKLVNQLGNAFLDMGIKQGDLVALYLPNSPEYIITYFALVRIGAVTVPFNILFKTGEISHILNDSKATVLVGASEEVEQNVLYAWDQLPHLKKIVTMGRPVRGCIDFWSLFDPEKSGLETVRCRPQDLALLMYTSGTTGRPKGAMLSLKNLMEIGLVNYRTIHIYDEDVLLTGAPYCHIFFALTILGTFYAGAALVTLTHFNPEKCLELISRYRVTHFAGVPTMYIYMLNKYDPAQYDLTSWRVAHSAGASLPVEHLTEIEETFKVSICETYGATETSSTITYNRLGDSRAGSVGKGGFGTEVRVVDNSGNQLPPGGIGEIVVKGPGVFLGYWEMPEATEQAFYGDWYRTGDLGRVDDDGCLYIVDRIKDMIVCSGYNIYPLEVEGVIYRNAKVLEAAVVGIKDSVRDQVAKAYIRLREGEEMTARELMDFCARELASYKVPREVEFLPELPKSPTGKILRRLLAES